MVYNDITNGFRTDPEGGAAAPPFTQPNYNFASNISFNGNLRKSPGRYCLEEFFANKPAITADKAFPFSTTFEVLGTNMTTALCTWSTTRGGIVLTTAGADNDQCILTPHLTSNYSGWAGVKWGTENSVIFETQITSGDDISTGVLLWAGLKLTNTPVVVTDNDQVFFRFSTDDSDTNWEIVYSVGGTDVTVDSGVAVATATEYNLRIEIDSDRKAHFLINDVIVANSTALTNDVNLIPYVGIQALAGNAEFVTVNYVKISRILFE